MMQKGASLFVAIFLLGVVEASAYTVPTGVPTPAFGLEEACGACTPTIWVNEATGNDANPGTEASPKATVPLALSAGAIVRIVGSYTHNHGSPSQIVASGTLANPVWILGGQIASEFRVTGTYVIVDADSTTFIGFGSKSNGASHHMVLRNTIVDAFEGSGGVAIQAQDDDFPTGTVSQVVVWNNTIRNTGDVDAVADDDQHCTATYKGGITYVWIMGNALSRCSGDGFQANGFHNPDTTAGAASESDLYFAGNTCSANRQTCGWSKQATKVLMVGNVANGNGYMRPSSGGPGICFGGQYNPVAIIIIRNACFNAENGISMASYDTGAVGGGIIAGNVLFNIHCTTSCGLDGGFTPGGGIRIIAGGSSAFVIANNSIYDTDQGLVIANTPPVILSKNNIFSDIDQYEIIIFALSQYSASSGYNLYHTQPTFDIEGTIVNQSAAQRDSAHSLWGDPLFVNPGTNFHLQSASPAASPTGNFIDLDSVMQSLYGTVSGINTTNIGALGVTGSTPVDPPPGPSTGPACTCGSIGPQ